MTRVHRVRVAVILLAVVVAAVAVTGCAQNGPMLSHQATLGSLKTSVSHLEFENAQLRHEVANLKAENRDVEDRLVQEESHNGELSARLDDARTLLSQRGGSLENPGLTDLDTPRKTLPAGRTTRKGRKPPFAQIPGRVDDLPRTDQDADADDPASRSGWRTEGSSRTAQNDNTIWLPVARGASETTPRR